MSLTDFIDPSDHSKTLQYLESPSYDKRIESMNPIPLAETVFKQSIIVLLSDETVWRMCDLAIYTALSGEIDCQEEQVSKEWK